MVKEFVKAWEDHKEELRNYIRTHEQGTYNTYSKLFTLMIMHIINYSKYEFDPEVDAIDNGDYQGTLLIFAHMDTYQPDIDEYIYTSVYYGSCCVCDTLERIHQYECGLPTKSQVDDYMSLCLHMLQRCDWLVKRDEEDE